MNTTTKILAGVAFAGFIASPGLASADEGKGLYLRGDVGATFKTEASVGGGSFDIDDGSMWQLGVGLDMGSLQFDGTISRESAELMSFADGHITTYAANAELDVLEIGGGVAYARGGVGVSDAEVNFSGTTIEGDGGTTWSLGGGFKREWAGVIVDVGYEYRNTEGLDFGFGADVDVDRHLLRVGVRFG